MGKGKVITLIIILIILIAVLVAILVGAIRNRGNWFMFGAGNELKRTSENIRKEETIDLSNIGDLELKFNSSDINLKLTEDTNLKVIQYSNKELKEDQLFWTEKSNSKVTVKEGEFHFFGFFNWNVMAYDIYLPKSYVGNLKVNSVSGNVEIDDELMLKELEIRLTSGDVNFTNRLKADRVDVQNVSGELEFYHIEAPEVTLKTTSGNIDVTSVKGKVEASSISGEVGFQKIEGSLKASSTSGNVSAHDFAITGESSLKSVSGNINVSLTPASNASITTKSVSGNIRLPNNANTKGSSPYHQLVAETTSGNIRID